MSNTLSHQLNNPDETNALAEKFAAFLKPGDTILLTGDIGAGKTHFSRSIIQCMLGYAEDVPSPTFTLVQTYPLEAFEIWHSDLYRLTDPNEVIELGMLDAFDEAVCLVEWPDRLAELAPASALSVSLGMTDIPGVRTIKLNWTSPRWDADLEGLNID